jgi:hypothetical protein
MESKPVPAGQSNRSSSDTMVPDHTRFPVAALAVVCMVTKDRLSVGKNNRDLVLPDDWTICPDLKEKAARKHRCRLRN